MTAGLGWIVGGGVALGVGTYAMRLTGPALRSRVTLPPRVTSAMETAAVVLLIAVAATATMYEAGGFAGAARVSGVAVGAVLAWRRAPLVVVIAAAAATTAVLRLIGMP
ncbi:Branched-chain amino acid transport protein (AzlD) [Rhodococcus triatomae]|uniref:Branched-chain amino acid transport protein (AzlD) n=1 Tax=Rhodococcus triatomae TaxID=300028 RepID=A0A1G8L5G1_9NOCA|nr:AzlD domain-containing protein [Rhodococcus triatomae]SDI50916.1 Branched-chain amino acid transport protein (AzlD) [Rhodococcus triatomae]